MRHPLTMRAAGALFAATLVLTACADDGDELDTSTPAAEDDGSTEDATDGMEGDRDVDDHDELGSIADPDHDDDNDEQGDAVDTSGDVSGADQVIEVAVADGTVDGGGRVEVALGDTVAIVVTSDVDDEVHVHGYDLFGTVEAGGSATVVFTADIPGVFEVELESTHLQLLELEIS